MNSLSRRLAATILLLVTTLASPALGQAPESAAPDQTRMMRMAPGGTIAYLEARDIDALWDAWQAAPPYVMWKDDRFAGFLSPLHERGKTMIEGMEKDMGVTFAELKRTFSGPIAVFISDRFERKDTAGVAYVDTNIGLIARVSSERGEVLRIVEEQSSLLTEAPAEARRYTERYGGVEIFHTEYLQTYMAATPSPGSQSLNIPDASGGRQAPVHVEYAMVEDWLIFLEGQRTFMKKVLDNFAASAEGAVPAGSLATDDNLRRAVRGVDTTPDLLLYLNLERVVAEVRATAAKIEDPWTSRQALGFDDVRSLAVGVDLQPRSLRLSLALHAVARARGIVGRLMQPAPPGGLDMLRRFPEDIDACWASRLDLSGCVQDFREAESAGGNTSLEDQISAVGQAMGADIDALLGRVGREMGSYSRSVERRQAGQTQASVGAFFVALENSAGLAPEIAKAATFFLSNPVVRIEYEPRDYQGTSIYAPKPVGAEPGAPTPPGDLPAFAVAGDLLLFANPPEEAEYAVRLATGRAESTIMSNESFRRDFPRGGEDLNALYWGDLRKIVEGGLKNLRTNPTVLMVLGVFTRPTAMPSPEAFGEFFDRVVGRVRCDGETLTLTYEMIHPEKFARKP